MALFGLTRDQLTFLGYPDYGTLQIWRDHWGEAPAFRSDATHTNAVPYPDAFDRQPTNRRNIRPIS